MFPFLESLRLVINIGCAHSCDFRSFFTYFPLGSWIANHAYSPIMGGVLLQRKENNSLVGGANLAQLVEQYI